MTPSTKLILRSFAVAFGLLAASCGSGGGGGGSFAIESVNLANNQVWQINRPILIRFSEPVDFATVSLNTINIRQVGGAPSAGEFSLQDASTVKFQPRCPLEDDLSDAGLLPGGVQYELKILGVDQGSPLTVKSSGGESLEQGDTRFFSTPVSLLPSDLFFDSAVGPPSPIVRSTLAGDTNPNACYLEIAGNDNQRHYFEKDLATGAISLDPPLVAPLNLLALQASKVELVLFFNQAINPSSSNVSGSRLPWQFQDANGLWTPLTTLVTLEAIRPAEQRRFSTFSRRR